jgi:hypothetical protein
MQDSTPKTRDWWRNMPHPASRVGEGLARPSVQSPHDAMDHRVKAAVSAGDKESKLHASRPPMLAWMARVTPIVSGTKPTS